MAKTKPLKHRGKEETEENFFIPSGARDRYEHDILQAGQRFSRPREPSVFGKG
jgi:hypothetical protein